MSYDGTRVHMNCLLFVYVLILWINLVHRPTGEYLSDIDLFIIPRYSYFELNTNKLQVHLIMNGYN